MKSRTKNLVHLLLLLFLTTTTTTTRGFLRDPSPPRRHSPPTKLQVSSTVAVAASAINTFWKSSPYAAAFLTCGIKASAADYIAQKRSHRKQSEDSVIAREYHTDKRQNIAFLLYGAVYQGVSQEFIYNHLYPRWFGAGTSWTTVLVKVLFDLAVQTTLLTLPVAYLTKALIFNYSPKEAMRRYTQDILQHGLLTKYTLLWGPVQCLTFSIVPEHWRVTFVACVSFFWLIILSSIASRRPDASVEAKDIGIQSLDEEDCILLDAYTCEHSERKNNFESFS